MDGSAPKPGQGHWGNQSGQRVDPLPGLPSTPDGERDTQRARGVQANHSFANGELS